MIDNLKSLSTPEIDHYLITLPSIIARKEEELGNTKSDLEEKEALYELEFSESINKTEKTSEDRRKAEAIIYTADIKGEILSLQRKYREKMADYHKSLNQNSNIMEIARNKRAEIKAQIEN